MEFSIDSQEKVSVVRPLGTRIDAASAAACKGVFVDLANQGRFHVVLDLGPVDFIDSSGLGALINGHKTLETRGRLVLAGASPKILSLLKLTRLDRVFTIAPSVAEARAIASG